MPGTRERLPSRWKSGRNLPSRVVIAYSGTINSSMAIAWLKERHVGEIVAVTLDVGQGRELSQIRERAMAAGANRCHVLDVREEFVRELALRALQADALNGHQLAIALSRPLIAEKLVQIAQMENASLVAHGCAEGADRIRVEAAVRAIHPDIDVIAPVIASGMSQADAIEFTRERRLPGSGAHADAYESRQNLWGRTIRLTGCESHKSQVPESVYVRTRSPELAPEAGAYVDIDWDRGVPVSINGVGMLLTELVDSLDIIAGGHGVGRFECTETDSAGNASRVLGEAPAATVLHTAHHDLERRVTSKDLQGLKRPLSRAYSGIIAGGSWFSPARTAIDAFAQSIQEHVSGKVRVELNRGVCKVVDGRPIGRLEAPKSDAAVPNDGPVWTSVSSDPTATQTTAE